MKISGYYSMLISDELTCNFRSTPSKNQLNPGEPFHRKSPAQRKSPKQHGVRNGSATPPRIHSFHNLQSVENGYHLTNGHHTESPKQFSDDIPFRKRTNTGKPNTMLKNMYLAVVVLENILFQKSLRILAMYKAPQNTPLLHFI